MIKKIFLIIILFATLVSFKSKLDNVNLNSPDGKVNLKIFVLNKKLNYQVKWAGQQMINPSELAIFSGADIVISDSKVTEVNKTWKPVWEQFSSINDHYKQLELDIACNNVKGKLYARAYDEGVAFRFVLKKGNKPKTANFYCSYNLPKESTYFAPNGENEPIGPLQLSELNDFLLTGNKDGSKKSIPVPLVVESPNHSFIALLESDLFVAKGFKNMNLGVDMAQNKIVSNNEISTTDEELISPWRVIVFGKTAGDLVVNTLTQNLASPNKIENTDWIKPGKSLWDWRVHGYVAPDGFKYGINTESYMRFIDFAAEKGIDYFLIDDAWYTKVTKGNFEMSEKLDLQKVIKYAKDKKVELLLYYDTRQGEYGDDELFPYYKSLGMKGIKYGFMGPNVPFTEDAIRKSAASKLLIDFHDSPVPMTGVHRTYPNAISREYCHGQQDSRKAFTPEAFIKMALINAITGPLDMNNGNFDLIGINSGIREKGPKKLNSYFSTVTSEAARTLIIFSGLVCIPDAPEAYAAKADLFEFIQKQPVGKWDESRILNSKMGDYITTARRHGEEWFIGSVYNQQGGTLDINLDFLDPNQKYEVTYYEDTKETNCKTNPEAYQVRKGIIKKGDVIKAVIAPGGGHCMWIRPKVKS
ncbi:glycoside hydrolase family 97 protein [Flavobacterium algicola]|uniref:glycoside hydrolase family 97 protein n=1 Tax=Flavobacterium algicola TaxID=556529 RepID=UPI001EFDE6C9|nr:glycoside hydrolase family 97 protein [Flavobacterium algicola]MCG9792348.1 glycoside hydrolase family 97 protein [Flavobacterium algicola]